MLELELVEPTADLAGGLLSYVESFGDEVINGSGFHYASMAGDDPLAIVSRLQGFSRGEGLPDGWMPSSTFWGVKAGEIVGMITLRHGLNEFLQRAGGHVGYSVHPNHRGHGYATRMLGLLLPKARRMSFARLLLTCEEANAASARVIEKCGGVPSGTVTAADGTVMRHFWIGL